ncbi:unnamed protein product, partial [Didymodactylos carnosus]
MLNNCLVLSFYIINLIFNQIPLTKGLLGYLQCWKCEITSPTDDEGEMRHDCNIHFDFTQHTTEQCDGKCWKSFEKLKSNNSMNKNIDDDIRASRRCFKSDELMKANSIGIRITNGCYDLKIANDKIKNICFCDNDM